MEVEAYMKEHVATDESAGDMKVPDDSTIRKQPSPATTRDPAVIEAGVVGAGDFPLTVRSIVAPLCHPMDSLVRAAWHEIWFIYFDPLNLYTKRYAAKYGATEDDAAEMVSGFKHHLLKKPVRYQHQTGKKFRAFLQTCLRHYIVGELRKKKPSDAFDEAQHASFPKEDAYFDRLYARALFRAVKNALRERYLNAGKVEVFDELVKVLTRQDQGFYADVAKKLNMSGGTLRVAMYRLRESFRELFRSEVAKTVLPEDLDAEIRHLCKALGSNYLTTIM
jgi:DNA-directed RNA polymerase specialized sigma24 family protein